MTARSDSSFEISFAGLWTLGTESGGRSEREPLAELAGAGEHVHGVLEILVQGRPLPALGYFGPDDVCFNEWVRELSHLRTAITGDGTAATHVYDEGEQGQPSYHFTKVGDEVIVSVRDGIGGGQADPEWEGVACRLSDAADAIDAFLRELETSVVSSAGQRGEEWFAAVLGE